MLTSLVFMVDVAEFLILLCNLRFNILMTRF